MIQEIVKDPIFLQQKSTPATLEDIAIGQDLLDTLRANADRCVGMAANMIGKQKRIIVFRDTDRYTVMYNPIILKCEEKFTTEEGCLSLPGTRKTDRFKKIKVQYENEDFKLRIKTYTGWTAQIIQHEIDHCNGVLI